MRPEDVTDERLNEALRQQPRWQPPRHFVTAVVNRLPVAPPVLPASESSSLPMILEAVTSGISGAAVTYVAGVLISLATPVLVDHATVVAWIGAAVALSIAAMITGREQEWM